MPAKAGIQYAAAFPGLLDARLRGHDSAVTFNLK